ncbi:MAG: division/cell wall cluster transcriptional repressor MraZ [Oscillospiraceae bacterium]|nr:division/cell wall cluster transcriptional repressor MraZ [Oscillospiraceae bacterium]
MTGIYQHSIDAKGRLFIPARLKDEIGEAFYVTISSEPDMEINGSMVTPKYLVAYSLEKWEDFTRKVEEMPRSSRRVLRPLFAHAAKCELDAQGRILLPQHLREYAGLGKNATVVGSGRNMEIWDAELWAAVDELESSPEAVAAALEALDF